MIAIVFDIFVIISWISKILTILPNVEEAVRSSTNRRGAAEQKAKRRRAQASTFFFFARRGRRRLKFAKEL